jgi:hypothetical protein
MAMMEKTHSLKVSKYKLWKTLHELGFKHAKINGNKKALVEIKVLKTNSHPGKNPVLHPACKITNLCPLLRGIFRAFEGLDQFIKQMNFYVGKVMMFCASSIPL